jgi:hypothetical protein
MNGPATPGPEITPQTPVYTWTTHLDETINIPMTWDPPPESWPPHQKARYNNAFARRAYLRHTWADITWIPHETLAKRFHTFESAMKEVARIEEITSESRPTRYTEGQIKQMRHEAWQIETWARKQQFKIAQARAPDYVPIDVYQGPDKPLGEFALWAAIIMAAGGAYAGYRALFQHELAHTPTKTTPQPLNDTDFSDPDTFFFNSPFNRAKIYNTPDLPVPLANKATIIFPQTQLTTTRSASLYIPCTYPTNRYVTVSLYTSAHNLEPLIWFRIDYYFRLKDRVFLAGLSWSRIRNWQWWQLHSNDPIPFPRQSMLWQAFRLYPSPVGFTLDLTTLQYINFQTHWGAIPTRGVTAIPVASYPPHQSFLRIAWTVPGKDKITVPVAAPSVLSYGNPIPKDPGPPIEAPENIYDLYS